jgi:4-hydroxythreonine-4-phosphate dehydrogenase
LRLLATASARTVSESAPLIITAGEPAGIGPELCLALAARTALPDYVVVSDPALLRSRATQLGLDVTVTETGPHEPVTRSASPGELLVVPFPFPVAAACGKPDTVNAETLLDGLRYAIDGCLQGRYRALVTAPLHKGVINDAGIPFSGHTEFLAEYCGAASPVMLLVAGELRIALTTTHLPLREVPDAITADRLRDVLRILLDDLRQRFGIATPEVVVCGLNPHAGEGGHLGSEDSDIITPVVAEFARHGEQVRGPLPADTAFTKASGHKDAVLAMYHDQGLPVLKYAGFGEAVNVTLGLPIVRTSVDHGTAFDLAGTGKASAGSLVAALEMAAQLTGRR